MKIDKLTKCMAEYIEDLHDMIDDYSIENERLYDDLEATKDRLHKAVDQADMCNDILSDIHDLILDSVVPYVVPASEDDRIAYLINFDSDENEAAWNKLLLLCGISEKELDS